MPVSLSTERWFHALEETWLAALDLVYPVRCVVCDRIGAGDFCSTCQAVIPGIRPPFCERCHKPGVEELCHHCRHLPPHYRLSRSVGIFDGSLRQAIHALKYERKERVAESLAELMALAWHQEPVLHDVDLLLPLPIHQRREGDRGFNQSALLARGLANRINLPLLEESLIRPIYRKPQVGMGREERQLNVAGVFEVTRPEEVTGRNLLLIDDVMTTGATCNEAAKTLLAAGAREVKVFTLAREP